MDIKKERENNSILTMISLKPKRFADNLLEGNFFLHPIHCDWHEHSKIQLYSCHVYFEKACRVRWYPHTFAQQWRTFALLTSSLFKGSFHSTLCCRKNVNQDANARARDGVGCENDRNELGCVIGCRNH